jgi:hypothetical protein
MLEREQPVVADELLVLEMEAVHYLGVRCL